MHGRGEKRVQGSVGKPEGKDHLEDQVVDGRIESKWTLGRSVGGLWSGFALLRIRIVGGLLRMRWWNFGFWRHGVSYFITLVWLQNEPWPLCCLLQSFSHIRMLNIRCTRLALDEPFVPVEGHPPPNQYRPVDDARTTHPGASQSLAACRAQTVLLSTTKGPQLL
jgi:hypothetical protein